MVSNYNSISKEIHMNRSINGITKEAAAEVTKLFQTVQENEKMSLATDTIVLHIANTQEYYNDAQEILERCGDSYDACIELKDMVDEIMFPEDAGQPQSSDHFFRQDMILEALSQVNWREVYERLTED